MDGKAKRKRAARRQAARRQRGRWEKLRVAQHEPPTPTRARAPPLPRLPSSPARVIHPPSRLPLHLVTPHGPGPNTLAPRLPPPGRALATNPNPISSPARRRRAAGQSSAHSVRGA